METLNVTLPNGILTSDGKVLRDVTLEALGPSDMDFIRSNETKQPRFMERLVRRCIVSIGPIEGSAEIAKLFGISTILDRRGQEFIDPSNGGIYMADLLYLFVKLRQLGVEDKYVFEFKCPDCSKKLPPILKSVSLGSDLPIDDQPTAYQGLREIEVCLDPPFEKTSIKFRPLFNYDEPTVLEINRLNDHERATREMQVQLLAIDKKPVMPEVYKDKRKMSYKLMLAISNKMNECVGGIDFELDVDCHRCGSHHKSPMPIDAQRFFFPKGIHGKSNSTDRSLVELKVSPARSYRLYGTTETSFLPVDQV